METPQRYEARLLSEQERQTNGVQPAPPGKKPLPSDKDVPPMTWKSVGALASAMLLAGTLFVSALVWPSHGVHGTPTQEAKVPLLVQTPAGTITGSPFTRDGYSYNVYKSVPFAKPPVGEHRFKRPQPLEMPASTDDVINSKDYKASCWSATKTWPNPRYSEDCLYLNVFVPDTPATSGRFPVMVWLHGGGFVAGSTFPEPVKMVVQGKVIVVTVNYRLGIFGFLTNMAEELPSNNGLWDQYMAIKWVHEHIEHFGGDSSSITVFGESAGAVSVGLHVLSPLTSGHFHKAILQSGAMTTPISRSPHQAMMKFADLASCSTTSETDITLCLRNVSVDTILRFSKPEHYVSSKAQRQFDFVWVPVVDGEFIKDEPLRLLDNATYLQEYGVYDKDYIIGVLNDEGALIATNNFFYPLPITDLANATFFGELRDVLLTARYGAKTNITSDMRRAVTTFYTGLADAQNSPSPTSVLDLAADILFVVPATEAALAVTRKQVANKTFFYHFDFCPETPASEAPCFGHGEDVILQFPKGNFTDPVMAQLSDKYISLLTSFAAGFNSAWPGFEPNGRNYLRISPSPDTRSHLYNYRVQFWLKTMPCLMDGSGSECGV